MVLENFFIYYIKGKGDTVMCNQEIIERRTHTAKITLTAVFLVLATITFVLTAVLGVASAGKIFYGGENNTLEEGFELLAILIYFILSSAVTVIFSVVSFIFGIILTRRALGKQRTFGKVSVVLSIVYVALPLLYVLVLNFV